MLDRPERPVITIDLPMGPFSTNDLYKPIIRNGKPALVRSKQYLAWLEEAGYRLNAQRPGRVSGPYYINLYIPRSRRFDLSNTIKSAEDLLVAHGITDDDKFCEGVIPRRWNGDGLRLMVVKTKGAR